ncbi:MAG: ATP-binding domain-containing protein, partial [Candidatus Eisenbacteria bacterium]|nr:ATP-binding domain-containing protein [Candidatus Eisenbacteria bacterium]
MCPGWWSTWWSGTRKAGRGHGRVDRELADAGGRPDSRGRGDDEPRDRSAEQVLRADWGYALTVHKAQGSEWPRVVVVDDNDPDHNVPSAKWNYVAYSRASEQLIVLRVKRETAVFWV